MSPWSFSRPAPRPAVRREGLTLPNVAVVAIIVALHEGSGAFEPDVGIERRGHMKIPVAESGVSDLSIQIRIPEDLSVQALADSE